MPMPMSIDRDRFDRIKKRWSAHSSWAVWAPRAAWEPAKAHVDDLSVVDPDANPNLLATLRPDVILLGLNASSRGAEMEPEPFRNFHDGSRHARDHRIRFALGGTSWWGAFMTDVLDGYPETDSAEVIRYVRANPRAIREQFDRLEAKIAHLGAPDPLLVAFGGEAYRLARQVVGDRHRLTRITHYSHRIGRDAYRAEVAAAAAGT